MEGISTNLLLLNGLLIAALIIYFAWRNSKRLGAAPAPVKNRKGLKDVAEELEQQSKGGAQVLPFERPSGPPPVIFNWNGHSWDAYEVLGVPKGSGMREVSQAYERAIDKMDDESRAFLLRAYLAIKEHTGS